MSYFTQYITVVQQRTKDRVVITYITNRNEQKRIIGVNAEKVGALSWLHLINPFSMDLQLDWKPEKRRLPSVYHAHKPRKLKNNYVHKMPHDSL